ncbi:FAD/NAD(P)-binding protein [Thermocatellispora tengchongensis]|uniref:hypothetical protein n=1 Tax=Thermocatellispora tengchongensis TaxID=1073253 RepID=UPI0036405D91
MTGADASPAGLTVRVAAGDGPRELDVGWVVNGTGPGSPADRDPLLAGLIAAGEARPDPLGLGLATAASGALLDAAGRPHDRLFTLGPTLRGTLYETTAIPEIRAQAARLARRLVDSVAAAGRADTVFGCRRVPSASVTTTES